MALTWTRTFEPIGEGQVTPAWDWRAEGWVMQSLGLKIKGCPEDLGFILSLEGCGGEGG